jgi:hypothetical protein
MKNETNMRKEVSVDDIKKWTKNRIANFECELGRFKNIYHPEELTAMLRMLYETMEFIDGKCNEHP